MTVLQPVLPASSSAMVVISDSGLKQDTGINGHRQNGRFLRGAAIKIDGLLTYVLGEAVIDIADPPVSG
jgi:hypothetical protein